MNITKSELNVSVFSDYICPFCYIGSERLLRLREDYTLKINWMFFEIHPETPAEGMPVEKLNYTREHWQQLMSELTTMAEQDGIHIAERTFTTNSRKAMLLAEAVKREHPELFYDVHRRLFEAFFAERQNIGDESVLLMLAEECGVNAKFAQVAWENPDYLSALEHYSQLAAKNRVRGVPTYIIGDQMVFGASAYEELKQAAEHASQQMTSA